MKIEELVRDNRSCRRFYEDDRPGPEKLKTLVNLARLSASAANRQPLRFILSWQPDTNAAIFPCLGWAGYLTDWSGPPEGERPAAYIIIAGDTRLTDNFWCDHGIAAQSIMLGAREMGLAGCMIGAFNGDRLRQAVNIPDYLKIMLVLALGKPRETVVIDDLGPDGDIRYWRDEAGRHHVPKRSLDDLIINLSEPNNGPEG